MALFQRMIVILRSEHDFALKLLKEVTIGKKIVFLLDDEKMVITATRKNGYTLIGKKAETEELPNFISTAATLRAIVEGTISLDHALVVQAIYLKAPMEEMLGIYRLVICLLTNGIIDNSLRGLWRDFDLNWPKQPGRERLSALINQLPIHGPFIKEIPEQVLLTSAL